VLCPGSGGWTLPQTGAEPLRFAYTEAGRAEADEEAARRGFPAVQLYDMQSDPAERTNLQATRRDMVAELTCHLERLVAAGRSTPGRTLPNDVPVDIGKA
jgi:hypothetical protein